MFVNFRYHFYSFLAKLKSRSVFPESIELDLLSLISDRPKIRVAIIDDQIFPFTRALETEGCRVQVFDDYSTKISQRNQKIKIIELSSYDVIICDIHAVGALIYPGSEGISVIEDLRKKYPLKVIVAYTGDPGAILTKLKRQDTLDKIFAKEWSVDDFLFNFREILDIFARPKNRWEFIQRRLTHLGLPQHKISGVQRVFVEHVLLCQMLSARPQYNERHLKQVISSASDQIDTGAVLRIGLKAAEVVQVFLPFVGDQK